MQAVSTRSVRGPRPTARKPCACEERQLEGVPSALRTDGNEHPLIGVRTDRRTDGRRGLGSRHEAKAFAEQRVQVILDEHLQLPMDRDDGEPRVARLLQAFDEERAVARFGQDVRIEVLPFHALGIRQDDPPNTQRGELGPQAPHHLRPGQGEQDIDSRPRRDVGLEQAAQRHPAITSGLHGADAERTIESTRCGPSGPATTRSTFSR